MENKINLKIHNRLFFRIYLYFGIVLSVFAILIGFIFIKLYEKKTTESYHRQLQLQGRKIARTVSQYVMNEDIINFEIYKEVLEEMQQSETTDVWIVSNPNAKNPMDKNYENIDLDNVKLPEEVNKVLESAFNKKVDFSNSYDDAYGVVMMRVATPILDAGGNAIGALLVNSYVQSHKDVVESSQKLIVNSILAALIISIIISIVFARQISHPISKIRLTTLELAEGNYEKTVGISQKDEIGELAATIDILAARLLKNEMDRKNMEQMRLDFFANVSHELRTPITVMRGYTETLVDGIVTEEEKVKKYYNRMLLECKSMERLVGDLLILSKMQNPDFVINAEPVNIIQIFDDIIRSAKVIGNRKNITVHLEKDNDSCMMMGDYDRLRQTFMIIMDNAVKFSFENGAIFIKISSKDNIIITISDQGGGILEEELPNIFDKFYKSRLRQNKQGSGLGLQIAKQIVIRHGGTISASSKINEGTTFEIKFDKLDMQEEFT